MIYDTAIPAYNDRPEPAVAFVKFLSEPNKKGFWKAAGFELMPVIELISDHLAGRPRMSALGHKRTFTGFFQMSAFPPKADIATLQGKQHFLAGLMSSSSSNSRERSKRTPSASCVRKLNDTRLARTEPVFVSCRSCNIFARRAHFTCHRSSKS